MALNLTGIENVEFYSGHYLDSVLEGDLKGLFDAWKKSEDGDGIKPPFKRLTGPASAWEKARRAASDENDPVERWSAARGFHAELIEVLGYAYSPEVATLEDGSEVPLVSSIERNGAPYLWILDTGFPSGEDEEALDAEPLIQQIHGADESEKLKRLPESEDPDRKGQRATWRELLDGALFRLDRAPRWILFLSGDELILAEQHKWAQGRFLRFDLATLLSRKEAPALKAFCALVHRDALAPTDGGCLHDTLEEKSHKHAFAVSGDLKHGVRRAIEILGNEAVRYRREVQKQGLYDDPDLADKLKSDCLTYMYRLLFLLYVEARGAELGVVPMKSEAYREGYSIESLRDLELVPLTTDDARNGFYLDHSLKTLFRIVNEGFFEDGQGDLLSSTEEEVMRVQGLRSPLFDDDRLQVLKGVRFRNFVLQEVVQLLSLSREKGRKSRGRISYAQLGISQLGSVYESLLSYTGFFADDPDGLYEVASKDDVKKIEDARKGKGSEEDAAIHYVPASKIDLYDEAEFVRDEKGRRVKHERGTFIYTLAGRSREKSASFYTPEVLTECVVKYALKELLEDEDGKRKLTADEILDLTVLEPAMGSGAFLIEAIDQLADAYLEARQEERDETLPSEQYPREKARVKARLATNNVHGVDFNATAVELAKTTLWLGAMAEGTKCPWFGLRLAHGNSLVGARREVFRTSDVTRKGTKDEPNWLGLAPDPVSLFDGTTRTELGNEWSAPRRPEKTIYHFLLPADGMAPFDGEELLKRAKPGHAEQIREWREEFTQPLDRDEADRLEELSDAVDRLFGVVARERQLVASATSDRITVWGEDSGLHPGSMDPIRVRDQEEAADALQDAGSAYRRLLLVMDAWCSLWFWPMTESKLLPTRKEWIASLELVLLGRAYIPQQRTQGLLFTGLANSDQGAGDTEPGAGVTADANGSDERSESPLHPSLERIARLRSLSDRLNSRRQADHQTCQHADVDEIVRASDWLEVVERVRKTAAFLHWELRFADVFASRGGFDLVVGNPPWIQVSVAWRGIAGDLQPLTAIRDYSAKERAGAIEATMHEATAERGWVAEEIAQSLSTSAFLSSVPNYPLTGQLDTNTYKSFLERGLSLVRGHGVLSLLIPAEGIFADPDARELRAAVVPRISLHARFVNQLKLFSEIGNTRTYSIFTLSGLYRAGFAYCCELLHPRTLDESLEHDGAGSCPGRKRPNGGWDLRGHRERVIWVDRAMYLRLGDDDESERGDWPVLPGIYSRSDLEFRSMSRSGARSLCDLTSVSVKSGRNPDGDERLVYEIHRPESVPGVALQGPFVGQGTCRYQHTNERGRTHRDYRVLDSSLMNAGFLPRTRYRVLNAKIDGAKGGAIYARKMLDHEGSQSIYCGVGPENLVELNSLVRISVAPDWLWLLSGLMLSKVGDFQVRTARKANLGADSCRGLLVPSFSKEAKRYVERRAALLAGMWGWPDGDAVGDSIRSLSLNTDRFAGSDRRLRSKFEQSKTASITDLERRWLQLELDVLCSASAGIGLDPLIHVASSSYGVQWISDQKQYYDQAGRAVPSAQTVGGQPAVSLPKLGDVLADQAGFDPSRAYAPCDPDTEALLASKVKLGKKEAEVLGVPQHCEVADLMTTCTVRYWDDAPDGTPAPPEGRTVELVALRYTDPGLEPRMERTYPTPWTRCDREEDYRTAWAEFERRLSASDSEPHAASAPLMS